MRCSSSSNNVPSLQLTSQHPYAEVYVGQPHVWTVDIENSAEVEKAIRSILSQKVRLKHTDESVPEADQLRRMTQVRCLNHLSTIKMSSKIQRSVKHLKMHFTERMSMSERSCSVFTSSHEFKYKLRTCSLSSHWEQWVYSPYEPAEPHMLRDPWRAGVYQAPAGLAHPPPHTPPPPAHKSRGSVNTRTTEAVCCLKSDVCPDFLLNCVFCDCEQIEPYLPYEFTCEGMLQRVNAFIENQVLKLKYQTAQICKI